MLSGIKILCCITEANFYLHLVSQILEYRNSEKDLLGGDREGASRAELWCGVSVSVRERVRPGELFMGNDKG